MNNDTCGFSLISRDRGLRRFIDRKILARVNARFVRMRGQVYAGNTRREEIPHEVTYGIGSVTIFTRFFHIRAHTLSIKYQLIFTPLSLSLSLFLLIK